MRKNKTKIQSINLDQNNLNDSCMKSLGELIQSSSFLQSVSIGNSYFEFVKISDDGIETITPYLIGNTSLKYFNLDYNEMITDKSVPLFVKMIESSHIEELSLQATKVTLANQFILPLVSNALKYRAKSMNLRRK